MAGEYQVNNATLLLFHGETEADAKFWQAVTLTNKLFNDVDNDNITSSYQSVAQVDNTYTSDLWALVLINSNGIFDLGSKKFKTTDTDGYTLTEETTIADLQKAITNVDFAKTKNFFMTNAVLSNTPGAAAATAPAKSNLSVLAKLADNCIKDNEEDAKHNPAGSVFVERAVAKATLSVASSVKTVAGADIAEGGVTWILDNTEKTSYLVRNMFFDGTDITTDYMGYSSEAWSANNFRFAGNVKIGTTPLQPEVNYYRTYWCVDPQYSSDVNADKMTRATTETDINGAVGINYPQYCNENTFNVTRQSYKNTTRAIVKVQLSNKSDFYTINGADMYYKQADAETALKKIYIADAGVINAIKGQLKEGKSYEIKYDAFIWDDAFVVDDNTCKMSIDGSKVKLNVSVLASSGNFKESLNENILTADISNAAAAAANTAVDVVKYTDGVMYYEARFQHFAGIYNSDPTQSTDLAPWNNWELAEDKTAPSVSEAYPANTKGAENNYLGRYGMVRNNWYDVTITKFNKIGAPNPTSIDISSDDTPDDNVNNKYISVKINVLAWAKRLQNWEF